MEESVLKWVKTSDELPSEEKPYLVMTTDDVPVVDLRTINESLEDKEGGAYHFLHYNVKKWMNIPTRWYPYKTGELIWVRCDANKVEFKKDRYYFLTIVGETYTRVAQFVGDMNNFYEPNYDRISKDEILAYILIPEK